MYCILFDIVFPVGYVLIFDLLSDPTGLLAFKEGGP